MALDEDQLAILLQASLERAGELLREDGGFLPFAGRVKRDGQIEFVQIAPEEAEPLDALLDRLGRMLAAEARMGEILGSSLVANTRLGGEEAGEAMVVLVETPGFCRSIAVPYRMTGGGVELGEMTPQPAEPAVFVDAAGAG
jgi:hypothetical protein